MLGGLYGLNFTQQSYLFVAQIIPSIVTILGLFYYDEAICTLLAIQLIYILIPLFYIKYLSKEGEVKAYLIDEFRGKAEQIRRGFSLFYSGFGMVLLALIFQYFWEDEIMDYLQVPLQQNFFYITAFMILQILFNPFLEEWFWRLFLMKTYKGTDSYRMLINGSYALFHLIILHRIFKQDWEFSIGFATYFTSIGGSFEHIRQKYGFITCVMAHYGVTLAASLVLLVVVYK